MLNVCQSDQEPGPQTILFFAVLKSSFEVVGGTVKAGDGLRSVSRRDPIRQRGLASSAPFIHLRDFLVNRYPTRIG